MIIYHIVDGPFEDTINKDWIFVVRGDRGDGLEDFEIELQDPDLVHKLQRHFQTAIDPVDGRFFRKLMRKEIDEPNIYDS